MTDVVSNLNLQQLPFQDGLSNARLVIGVTMDKDGKKIVSIQSSITISNRLPDRIAVYSESAELMQVEPGNQPYVFSLSN